MNTQHTPGPWYVQKSHKRNIMYDGEIIATARPDKEAEANARLIAAAPELLENLARIIDRIEESGLQDNFPSAYKRAKAAINAATGNS